MNFSIADGLGLLGGWIVLGALMIAFTVVATIVVRVVRRRDDTGNATPERSSEDDFIL